ncbi:hypothetical protein [Streptomyces sp. NPDC058451]|uniref:hypothetical protein n=1 Tax=Streptomyces sp. NPDC058451 TaxID=3346506 RepID=UPI00365E5B3C
MNLRARVARLVAVAGFAATVSSCGYAEPCAGVGVSSYLSVSLLQSEYPEFVDGTYELCAFGHCSTEHFVGREIMIANLDLPDEIGPAHGTVRLRMIPKGARTPTVDESAEVTLDSQSDNCGGFGYNRGLALTKAGGLSSTIPTTGEWDYRKRFSPTTPPASPKAGGSPAGLSG